MKKLKNTALFNRRSKKKWKKELRRSLTRKEKLESQKKYSVSIIEGQDKGRERKGIPEVVTKVLHSPSTLDFENNFDESIAFLNSFEKEVVFKREKKLRVDLSKLENITMECCIVLTGEIRNIFDKKIMKRINYIRPDSLEVHGALIDLGFYEHFNSTYSKSPNKDLFLQARSGVMPDPTIADDLVSVFKLETGITDSAGSRLYEALLESMVNVNHHAYSKKAKHRRWWLMGAYNSAEKRAKFTFFDKGRTIPLSLKKYIKKSRTDIIQVANPKTWIKKKDDELIMQAVTRGYSRTKKTTRGKGLPSLRHFLNDQNINGILRIYSGRGKVTAKSKETNVEQYAIGSKVNGTLISWEIEL